MWNGIVPALNFQFPASFEWIFPWTYGSFLFSWPNALTIFPLHTLRIEAPKTIAPQRERTIEVFRHQRIHSFQRTNSCRICEFVTRASQMNTSHTMHSTKRRCVDEGSGTSQMALVSWPNQCFRCFYWHCACKIAQFYSGLPSFRLWTRTTLVWIQIERAAAKSNIQLCHICFKPPIGIWKTRACRNLYFIEWYRFQSH
jgi:hypothetical protein